MIKELILNEYSLAGQFRSKEDFIESAMTQIVGLLNELPKDKGILIWKKTDLYQHSVTPNADDTLHSILRNTTRHPDTLRFKMLAKNLLTEPYWDNDPKQDKDKTYRWKGKDVSDTGLAEACERDKVIVSWEHPDFTQSLLSVNKGCEAVDLINLRKADDYDTHAINFGWSPVPFSLKCSSRFMGTNHLVKGAKVYQECDTEYYWYKDTFHHNHYEVFDRNGNHLGEANLSGDLDTSKADPNKKLWT